MDRLERFREPAAVGPVVPVEECRDEREPTAKRFLTSFKNEAYPYHGAKGHRSARYMASIISVEDGRYIPGARVSEWERKPRRNVVKTKGGMSELDEHIDDVPARDGNGVAVAADCDGDLRVGAAWLLLPEGHGP